MKVLILTYGTRGDVQPYVAIGRGLVAAGHEVTIATSVRFQEFVESHGLRYGYLNDDLLSIIDTDLGKQMLETGGKLLSMIPKAVAAMKRVKPAQRAMLRESWEAACECQPDVVLFHPKGVAGPMIAERLAVPAALLTPIPMHTPTAEFPVLGLASLPLGGWYNRGTYKVLRYVTRKMLTSYVREFREMVGLPPSRAYSLTTTADGRELPALHLYSEAVLPRPADWPESATVAGYCFLDRSDGWSPPPQLEAFLAAGPPSVYVGFGSMAGRDPERLARVVVEAFARTGRRGVLATGWGGLRADRLPDNLCLIDHAPHDWLLPRVSAVVHHGGAGSTAAGLRAGKPTQVVPFFGDQPFWGRRVHALGAGPKPIDQKRLTPDRLAASLVEITENRAMRDTAAHLGERIRGEDGVGRVVGFVNSLSA